MNIEEVREYTLSLPGVTEDQAFGEDILNFRLEGKIFVCLWLGGGRYDMKDGVSRIALKLSPDRNIELREQFSTVTPAYHWNKTHWSDVYYEEMDEAIVKGLIKESYRLIISKLPKSIRSKYIDLKVAKMKLKKRKIKYAAIFFLCWFAFLVFLVDGVLQFQTLVDFFGSYILVETALLLLVFLPTWIVYKFTEER